MSETSYLAKNLEFLMNKQGLNANSLQDKSGITQSTTSRILNGSTKNPRDNVLQQYVDFFGVSVSDLRYKDLAGQGEMTAKPTIDELRQKIKAIENRSGEVALSDFLSANALTPIISWVAAGSWNSSSAVEWLDENTEYLPCPTNLSKKGFCLEVRGVSMMPEFKPKEIIFVEPEIGVWDLQNSDLVVVRENGNHEATFKQLIIGDTSDDMYLKPLNPDWHEQKMTPKSEWELVGKVVGKWVKY